MAKKKPPYTLKQRSNSVYFIEYSKAIGITPDGKVQKDRIRVSLNTKDLKTAQNLAPTVFKKHIAGEDFDVKSYKPAQESKQEITLYQLFEECRLTVWKNLKGQKNLTSNIKVTLEHIGNPLIKDIDFRMLNDLLIKMRKEGYEDGTIKRKMSTISSALNHAVRQSYEDGSRWISHKPPFPTIKLDNVKNRFLSDDEEKAILKFADERAKNEPSRNWFVWKALFIFLLDHAARLSEGTLLDEAWIKPHGSRLIVEIPKEVTKNGKPKTLPLSQRFIDLLPALRQLSNGTGKLLPLKNATAWYMLKNIKADVNASDLKLTLGEDVNLHTLRHTAITRLVKSGKFQMAQISSFAGHSDISITYKRYSHLDISDNLTIIDHINAA